MYMNRFNTLVEAYYNPRFEPAWLKASRGKKPDPSKVRPAYYYAKDVLKARWPEAEPHILKFPRRAIRYAKQVIKGRWPELERVLLTSPKSNPLYVALYAKEILKGTRWPEAEQYLINRAQNIDKIPIKKSINRDWNRYEAVRALVTYANGAIKGRWPEAEPYILALIKQLRRTRSSTWDYSMDAKKAQDEYLRNWSQPATDAKGAKLIMGLMGNS